jgi:hypothetical protein
MSVWRRIKQIARIAASAVAIAAMPQAAAAAEFSLTSGIPANFDDLSGPRDIVVDVYFGGRPLGEARAIIRPGFVRFRDPAGVAALLAGHGDAARIAQVLESEIPNNSGRSCTRVATTNCGHLEPQQVGIIFDEAQFRVDFFLSGDVANAAAPMVDSFLVPTSDGPAVVSSLGAAMSGSGGDNAFNFQSRTILSLGDARLKTNLSYSSDFGAVADDLLLEVDKPNWRYTAGLFWTPGTSLVGRRRILGVGAASQFDTRTDREQLEGTSLPVFVQQPSVVEILIDGRLAGSQVVEAGNKLIDTSGLPEGSYPIILRVREKGRGTRDERRFFVKDTRLPPQGHIRFQAFAGVISPTREGSLINLTNDLYYQLGAAKRISGKFGVEAIAIGTKNKIIAENGLVYLTDFARLKAGGLVSSKGEFGAVLQAVSSASGPMQFSFDLRRVWDGDGGGLIPGSVDGFGFDGNAGRGLTRVDGDYTQMNATVGYSWGKGTLRLFASYFDSKHGKSQYSIGPSGDWLLAQRPQFQLRLEADAQRSRDALSGYIGVRFNFATMGLAMSGASGHRVQDDKGSRARSRSVGNFDGEWSGESSDLGRFSVGVGVDRTIDATTGRASGNLNSRYGNLRSDVIHDFNGRTQYGVSLQTGIVLGSANVAVGGRNVNESALLVGVDGNSAAGEFEVLIDDTPMAKVAAGQKATLFMQPYRQYNVRLRPLSATSVHYDAAVRQVTLFPGNVQRLSWKAVPTYTVFGRVVDKNGIPIANGLLKGSYGDGASNADGYFQIDAAAGDRVTLSTAAGQRCSLKIDSVNPNNEFFAAGKVLCE